MCAKFHVQKHSQAVKLLTAHCNSTSGAQSFTGMSYVQYFYQSTNCLSMMCMIKKGVIGGTVFTVDFLLKLTTITYWHLVVAFLFFETVFETF